MSHRAGITGVLAAPMLLAVAAMLAPVMLIGGASGDEPGGAWCGGGGTAQTVTGFGLDAEQMGNAHTIVAVTVSEHLPSHAAVIALATAMQESTLRNLDHGDRDSLGLFQQRVSLYGAAVAADPVKATRAFLARLRRVPGWQRLPLTQAAQAVQHSAFPTAYARWQPMAELLTAELWPAAAAGTADPAAAGGTPTGTPCAGDGGAVAGPPGDSRPRHGVVAGTTTVPAGLVVNGTPAARVAVTFALAQLGKPYVWGAVGPKAFDCSGLTMAAWAAAGTPLPHHAASQVGHGTPEPPDLSQAVAGDLVFIPGADGTAQNPGHVGMIVGRARGRLYLIQAPMTGIPVEITDAAQWAGQIVGVRHIG